MNALREAITDVTNSKVDPESVAKLQNLLDVKKSADIIIKAEENAQETQFSDRVFCASQVPLPSEYDFSKEATVELKNALDAAKEAKKALREAQLKLSSNTAKVKVIKCAFSVLALGGAVAATVFTGPIAAPLVFFAFGSTLTSFFDAGSAIAEHQRFKNEKDPLPFKDNGIANALYFMLSNGFKVKEDKAKKAAKVLSGIINFSFTLGGKWPAEDPEFEKN